METKYKGDDLIEYTREMISAQFPKVPSVTCEVQGTERRKHNDQTVNRVLFGTCRREATRQEEETDLHLLGEEAILKMEISASGKVTFSEECAGYFPSKLTPEIIAKVGRQLIALSETPPTTNGDEK